MYFHPSTVKQSFDLEEYSLSQSTLEQVGWLSWFYNIRKSKCLVCAYPLCLDGAIEGRLTTLPFYLLFSPFQVFLELSKEQELDDFDNELDLSVKWKLLPQEEP